MADVQGDGWARRHVFDLVGAYGPGLDSLCRQGPALIADTAGIGVSAAVVPGQVPRTRFSSDPISALLEFAQLEFDEGPCRDAAAGAVMRAADLDDSTWQRRWPRFTPAALHAGVRSVCALPLHAGGVHHDGALGLFRRTPGDWDDTEQGAAATFAAAACELLTLQRLDLDLTGAFMKARLGDALLEMARGTVVEARHCLADDTVELPLARWFTLDTLTMVRAEVSAVSAHHRIPDKDVYRLTLAVHEAMLNAVQHGGGHGQLLLWRRAGQLWCEISDHGPGIEPRILARTHPRLQKSLPSGLWVIRRAYPDLEVTTDGTGTRLLLRHPLPAARP